MKGTTTVTYGGKWLDSVTNEIVSDGINCVLEGVVQTLDRCPTCGETYHPMFDHSPCARVQMQAAARRIGEAMARRRNQAILDVILGRDRPEDSPATFAA